MTLTDYLLVGSYLFGAAMWGFMWKEFSRLRLQIERQIGLHEGQRHEERISALERAMERTGGW